jgi:hypothetical protein
MRAMKSLSLLAAFSAVATFSAGGAPMAAAQQCTGPFASCAHVVQATCSYDASGRQRMTYWDFPGNVMQFERCVARIFQAHGQPSPYTPEGMAAARRGGLTVPYTELLYPKGPP